MQPEQKKARIQQITASQELKRSTPSKDSIAMENPAYVATQKEVSTSKFSEKHVKRVTPGERQTLLRRCNKEFSTRRMKTVSVSSKEEASMTETGNDGTEPLQQPEVMIYGNTLNFIQYLHSK
ncbi:hypothetical protein CFC21_047143 [Triticum aestivum]|uniref:Uncharacterized protein n=2 Tax=Triticum aestivum TaxID=4565 RepID=A0A3B6GQR0_WHEAT|nr:hypothetical protein CFC21_047143 [Triticum aestivum]